MSFNKKIEFKVSEVEKLIDLLSKNHPLKVLHILEKKLNPIPRKVTKYLTPTELVDKANRYRDDLISRQTESEKVFKALLKSIKLEYEFQKIFWYTKGKNYDSFYILDFYIPSANIVVEIDGEYHNEEDQKRDDKIRSSVIRRNGILKIVRFTNNEVLNDHENIINKLNFIIKDIVKDYKIIDGVRFKKSK